MSGFSADWLRLREPFDRAARAAAAAALDLRGWAAPWRPPEGPLDVVDLGCGSGANLRELAPRLGGAQRWCLVDHDAALLAALPAALAAWADAADHRCVPQPGGCRLASAPEAATAFTVELTTRRIDLARDLAAVPFAPGGLVTGSALLDLVSADWLQALVARSRAARSALLFALNIDGRHEWDPNDADDDALHAAFARHQRRDKGFGPALGAAAVAAASDLLGAAGYRVQCAASDWVVDAATDADGAMRSAMVDGIAAAALEHDAALAATVAGWRARRLAQASTLRLRVGHQDLIATP